MTTETRCDCCDLPSSMCGKAAEDRQRAEQRRERAALLARPGWFKAMYDGTCAQCRERFEAGTPIRLEVVQHDDPGYVAECCA